MCPHDFPWDKKTGPLYKAVGCRECRNTGYRGRMGIYELLVTTNDIRQLAHDRVSSWKIMQARHRSRACARCGRTAGCKVLDGRTTVDEVVRNAKADHSLLHEEIAFAARPARSKWNSGVSLSLGHSSLATAQLMTTDQ